jgi:hypothetical protein
MFTSGMIEERIDNEWPIRPYYKRELALAYAPNIAPTSALNRLSVWLKMNGELYMALKKTGYVPRQKVFTSMQVELIFRYLGRP